MICQPTSATYTPYKQAFAHIYHQESEECFRRLEKIFAREALETYAQEKAGESFNYQEVRRIYVLSTAHYTWEQVILHPAHLLRHVDKDLTEKLKDLHSAKKEFFNTLLEKTLEKLQCQTKATLAHLICECEFGPQKKFVNLKYSNLVRTIVLQATDRFFSKAKL